MQFRGSWGAGEVALPCEKPAFGASYPKLSFFAGVGETHVVKVISLTDPLTQSGNAPSVNYRIIVTLLRHNKSLRLRCTV